MAKDVLSAQDSTTKTPTNLSATNKALHTYPAGLRSGEDPLNNVVITENGDYGYQWIDVNTTAVLGGTGASGDKLHALHFFPISVNPGSCYLLDNTSSMQVLGGGTGSIADKKPWSMKIDTSSINGAWSVTTGADIRCLAVGRFTP